MARAVGRSDGGTDGLAKPGGRGERAGGSMENGFPHGGAAEPTPSLLCMFVGYWRPPFPQLKRGRRNLLFCRRPGRRSRASSCSPPRGRRHFLFAYKSSPRDRGQFCVGVNHLPVAAGTFLFANPSSLPQALFRSLKSPPRGSRYLFASLKPLPVSAGTCLFT